MPARSRAVLKTLVLFVAQYDSTAWTTRTKALRLACWNADGVRGRKLQLDHFHGQYAIDIYLLTATDLR